MGQHDAAPLALAPPEPEQFEQLWREHRVAALALFHADQHALAVDIIERPPTHAGPRHRRCRALPCT